MKKETIKNKIMQIQKEMDSKGFGQCATSLYRELARLEKLLNRK